MSTLIELLQKDSGNNVVPSISKTEFERMCSETIDAINARYLKGTVEHLRIHYPDLYKKTCDAERRINKLWQSGSKTEAFQASLDEWSSLNIRGIEIFSTHGKTGRDQS